MTSARETMPARRQGKVRAVHMGLWVVRGLLALQFIIGGLAKLTGDAAMVTMFTDIGAGQGLRYLVGACELAGAIGLLIPRLYRLAACGLVLLMIGAAVTNVVFLQINPILPLVFGAMAAVVAVADRRSPGRDSDGTPATRPQRQFFSRSGRA